MAERKYGLDAINTRANWLTVGRMATGGLLGLATYINKGKASLPAALTFGAIAASDRIDGQWAREDGVTRVGMRLDPLADIVAVGAEAAALAANGRYSHLALALLGVREVDVKSLRSRVSKQELDLPASTLSKAKTVAQMIDVGVRLFPQTSEHKRITRTTAAAALGLTLLSWADLRLKARALLKEREPNTVSYPIYWDCDGVLVGKPHKFNIPGRATKAYLPRVANARESLETFEQSDDFANVAVATSRDELLRGRQTMRHLQSPRHDVVRTFFGEVLYSDHNYTKKIEDVLRIGAAIHEGVKPLKDDNSRLIPHEGVERVVLIDDSDKKIVKGIIRVTQNPLYANLLHKLVYVDFGHSTRETYERIQSTFQEAGATDVTIEKDADRISLQTNDVAIPIIAMPRHGKEEAKRVMEAIRNLPGVA